MAYIKQYQIIRMTYSLKLHCKYDDYSILFLGFFVLLFLGVFLVVFFFVN